MPQDNPQEQSNNFEHLSIDELAKQELDNPSDADISYTPFEESLVGGYDESDLAEYSRLDVNLTRENLPYWDKQRAQNQSWQEQSLNAAGRLIKIIPTTIQNFSTLLDPQALVPGTQTEYTGNSIYNFMEEWKQNVDEALPIYQVNPEETFDFGDSAWWLKNISGTVESAAAFVLSSYITGQALGRAFVGAAKGLRALTAGKNAKFGPLTGALSPQAANVAKGSAQIANSLLANHMEGFGVAAETVRSAKNIALQQGKTEEEANSISAEAGAIAYNLNRLNFFLNLTSAGALISSPMHTRKQFSKITAMTAMKSMGLEAAQEGLEEEINFVAQKKGEAFAKGERYGFGEAFADMASKEGLESAFWGAIGGAGQTGLTSMIGRNQTKENNRKYATQQKVLDQYNVLAKSLGSADVEQTLRLSKKLGKTLDDLDKSILQNDEEQTALLKDEVIDLMSFQAFETGTTEQLINLYKQLEQGEEIEGAKDQKEVARKAIERIEKLEKDYLNASTFYNSDEVFLNRANKDTYSRRAKEKVADASSAKTNLYTKITDKQQTGEISSVVTRKTGKKTYSADTDEKITGTKVTDTNLTEETIDYQIAVDPNTFEVIGEEIPQDIKNEVAAKIEALPEFKEWVDKEGLAQQYDQKLKELDFTYEIMTSPEFQQSLVAAKKLEQDKIKAVEKQEKKDAEKSKIYKDDAEKQAALEEKKRIEDEARAKEAVAKEAGTEVKKTSLEDEFAEEKEGTANEEDEAVEKYSLESEFEDEVIEEPETTEEKPSEEEIGGPRMDLAEDLDLDEEVPGEEETEETGESENEEVFEEAEETINDKDPATIDDEAEEEINKERIKNAKAEALKSIDKQYFTEEGIPEYEPKVTNGASIFAYLAKAYKNIKTTVKGVLKTKKVDVDNELLENYDTRLITDVMPGSDVTLVVVDKDDLEVTDPKTGDVITWLELKRKYSSQPQLIEDNQPIGIVINENETPVAYLHTPQWINKNNVSEKHLSVDEQRAQVRAIRSAVVSQGSVTTKVSDKSLGVILSEKDGKKNKVSENLKDPDLKIAVIRKGEFVKAKDDEGLFEELNVVNAKDARTWEGATVTLIPTQGRSNKDALSYIAIPLDRVKVQEQYADSIINMVRIWYKSMTDSLTDEDLELIDQMGDFNPELFYGQDSLTQYISSFIQAQPVDGVSEIEDTINKAGNKSTHRLVGFGGSDDGKKGKLIWKRGKGQTLYISDTTKPQDLESLLSSLKRQLLGMKINYNLDLVDTDIRIPLLNDNEITTISQSYNSFAKDNLETDLYSSLDAKGNHIYTIQHVIGFDSSFANEIEAPFEADQSTQSQTPVVQNGKSGDINKDGYFAYNDNQTSEDAHGMDSVVVSNGWAMVADGVSSNKGSKKLADAILLEVSKLDTFDEEKIKNIALEQSKKYPNTATTLALTKKNKDGSFSYFVIGDSEVIVFDSNGKEKIVITQDPKKIGSQRTEVITNNIVGGKIKTGTIKLDEGDSFLIASDGLTEFKDVLRSNEEKQKVDNNTKIFLDHYGMDTKEDLVDTLLEFNLEEANEWIETTLKNSEGFVKATAISFLKMLYDTGKFEYFAVSYPEALTALANAYKGDDVSFVVVTNKYNSNQQVQEITEQSNLESTQQGGDVVTKKEYKSPQELGYSVGKSTGSIGPSRTTRKIFNVEDDLDNLKQMDTESVQKVLSTATNIVDNYPGNSFASEASAELIPYLKEILDSRKTSQPTTNISPKGAINVYWGQAESETSTKILSNLAPRKFTWEGREYGSVEHAYQSNKSGTFDKTTYDKYVKAGGYGTKIRGKGTVAEMKAADSLGLMKKLVVESFKQNLNSEAAKKLLQYENFTHNTNQLIDQAFLEGLKLAQKELLNTTQTTPQPQTTSTTSNQVTINSGKLRGLQGTVDPSKGIDKLGRVAVIVDGKTRRYSEDSLDYDEVVTEQPKTSKYVDLEKQKLQDEIDSMEDGFSLGGITDENDDYLPDFDRQRSTKDVTFSQEQKDSERNKYLVKGMSFGQSTTILDWVKANLIQNTVVAKKKNKKITKQDQYNLFKNYFTKTRDLAALNEQSNRVEQLNKIIENFPQIMTLVDLSLKQDGLISSSGDIDMSVFDETGTNLEKKSYEDDGALKVDSKKTASKSLKQFLSSIADAESVDGKGAPVAKKGWLGLPIIKKYDQAFNELSEVLAGLPPVYSDMKTMLKSHYNARPWFANFAVAMDNAPDNIQAEFVSLMAKHYVEMKEVTWSNKGGSYSLEVNPVNANSVSNTILETWNDGLRESMYEANPVDETENIPNKDMIGLLEQLISDVKETPSPEGLRAVLTAAGVEISDSAWEQILSNGLNYSRSNKTVLDLINKRGGIIDSLEKHITKMKKGIALEQSTPFSESNMKALALLEARHNPVFFSNSYRNGENKMIYSYSANKYLVNRVRDLAKDEVLADSLAKIPFSSTSRYVEELKKKKSVLKDVFKISYFDTLKEKDSRLRGTVANQMSTSEQEIFRLGLFQNRGLKSSGQRIINLVFPTTSDKKVPMSLTTTAVPVSMKKGVISNKTINEVYKALVVPEINRIRFHNRNEGKFNIKSYEQGAQMFHFIPKLNTLQSIWDEEGNLKNIVGDSELEADIAALVKQYIADEVSYKLKEWEDLGIGKNNQFLDATYMKTVAGGSIEYAATDFVINTMIGNAEMYQTIIGDPAVFYKSKVFNKLDMRQARADSDTDAFVQASKDTFNNIGKRLAGEVAPGVELAMVPGVSKNYRQLFMEDRISTSTAMGYYTKLLDNKTYNPAKYSSLSGDDLKSALKKDFPKSYDYFAIEGTDAQELTTLSEHLETLLGLGKINKETFDQIKKKIDNEGDSLKLTTKELTTVLQPVKPVYVGNHLEHIDGRTDPAVDMRVYVKSSSFPLIPELTKGTPLDKLRVYMRDNNIARAAYGTAAKVGAPKRLADVWVGEDMSFAKVNDSMVRSMDRSNFRIQQEIPYKKDKKEIKDGTQKRKLLFSNLLDVKGFKFNGKTLTGQQLQDEYNKIYNKIFTKGLSDFKKEFIEEKNGRESINFVKLNEFLTSAATEQGFSLNELELFELNDTKTDFKVPLWMSPSADKIEALLNSLVDKRIVDQERRGNSFVLGSEEGVNPVRTWESLTKKEKNSILYVPGHQGKSLSPQQGSKPAEVLMPSRFKNKDGELININSYVKDGELDLEKIPEELLEMFAYRIPTQGLNSMSKIKVVGFLPEHMGDLLIAPREWTIQMGSDFDVDKIYVDMYETYQKGNTLQKATEGVKGLQNEILDIELAVLSNENKVVQAQIATPLAFGNLPDMANEIEEYTEDLDYNFNPLGPTYQRNKYMGGTAGKAGTGVFSLDSTLNASMQGKNIVYRGPDVIFGDQVFKGYLSNPKTIKGDRFKSDVIAAYQSAAVDNEKEQLLGKLNINNETFDAIRALNQMGFDEEVVTLFINQPIVLEYVKELRKAKDSTAEYNQDPSGFVMDKLFEKYTGSSDPKYLSEFFEENLELYDSGVETLREELSNPSNIQQAVLLNKFLKISGIGEQLKSVQSAINTDSAGISPSLIEVTSKVERVKNLQKLRKTFGNITKLIGDYSKEDNGGTPISVLEKGVANTYYVQPETINGFATMYGLFTTDKTWNKFFPYRERFVEKTFNYILINQSEETLAKETEKKQKLWKEIKKYLNAYLFTDSPNTERQRLFFDTPEDKNSLASRVKELQLDPKMKRNAFIQRLQPKVRIDGKPSLLKYNAGVSQDEDMSRVYAGFIDLMNTDLELATDLVKYSFLEGGIQEAIQFVKFVPSMYLTALNTVSTIDNEIKTDLAQALTSGHFAKQYYQHHPYQTPRADKKMFVSYKPNADELVLNKEGLSSLGIKEDGEMIGPYLLSVETKNVNKGVTLYQKVSGSKIEYRKIDVLGAFGFNQYSPGETNTKSLLSYIRPQPNQVPKTVVVSLEADLPELAGEETVVETTPKKPNVRSVTDISSTSDDSNLREVAKVLESLTNQEIEIEVDNKLTDSEGIPSKGKYRPSEPNKIRINVSAHKNQKDIDRTIIHEYTHALTSNFFRSDTKEAKAALVRTELIWSKLKEASTAVDADSKIGMFMDMMKGKDQIKRAQELTAFAMMDPEVQDFMKAVEYKRDTSVWNSIVKLVKDIFNVLGAKQDTAFEGALSEAFNAIENNSFNKQSPKSEANSNIKGQVNPDGSITIDRFGLESEFDLLPDLDRAKINANFDKLATLGIINKDQASLDNFLNTIKNCK